MYIHTAVFTSFWSQGSGLTLLFLSAVVVGIVHNHVAGLRELKGAVGNAHFVVSCIYSIFVVAFNKHNHTHPAHDGFGILGYTGVDAVKELQSLSRSSIETSSCLIALSLLLSLLPLA